MQLSIGNKVRWESAAGVLRGTIRNIVLSKNAADKVVPWMDIDTGRSSVRLCATDSNLLAMRVVKFSEQ